MIWLLDPSLHAVCMLLKRWARTQFCLGAFSTLLNAEFDAVDRLCQIVELLAHICIAKHVSKALPCSAYPVTPAPALQFGCAEPGLSAQKIEQLRKVSALVKAQTSHSPPPAADASLFFPYLLPRQRPQPQLHCPAPHCFLAPKLRVMRQLRCFQAPLPRRPRPVQPRSPCACSFPRLRRAAAGAPAP